MATRISQPQGARANVASLPAPVGGWNARDSLANMDPADAVQLDNFFPTVGSCVLRGGSSVLCTVSGTVKTLMNYAGGTTERLFAITASGTYRVDTGTAVAQTMPTLLTQTSCEYTNISTTGGNFMVLVNGVQTPVVYNGTDWKNPGTGFAPAITFGASAPAGMSTSKFSNITLFKNRLWFIEKDTLRAWYLPTLAIGGQAEYIDMSSIAKFGGHLVDLDTWTVDAGYGVDDNLAFITSNGEVIVYRGTDPASAATWALAGVWKLGSPIGTKAMLKYGGDLLILTYDGLMPMAQSLQSSRLDPRVALSNKIQGAIAQATSQYGSHTSTGWQIYYSAKNNAVWINVPVQDDLQEQYVMNTITTSWCRFKGWGAYCWETFNDNPYFGGNGFVARAWDDTYSDNRNVNTLVNTQSYYINYYGGGEPVLYANEEPNVSAGQLVTGDYIPASTYITYVLYNEDESVWEVYLSNSVTTLDYIQITVRIYGVISSPNPILTEVSQAYNYFEQRGVKKYFTRARPTIFTDGSPSIGLGMNIDFEEGSNTYSVSTSPVSVTGVWDTSLWDSGIWAGGIQVNNNWQGITGIGYCGSLVLKTNSSGVQIEWPSTDVVYQSGWAGI